MGKKIASLRYLASLGFNTPNLLLEIPGYSMSRHGRIAMLKRFHKDATPGLKVSIRTEHTGREFKCPHLPNRYFFKAYPQIMELTKEGYTIYIFEAIDPKQCKARGNFTLQNNLPFCEYLLGPGTVRDLENKGRAEIKQVNWDTSYAPNSWKEQLREIVNKKAPHLNNKILEFSHYSSPVGNKKEKLIFWELRKWQ